MFIVAAKLIITKYNIQHLSKFVVWGENVKSKQFCASFFDLKNHFCDAPGKCPPKTNFKKPSPIQNRS